MTDVIDKKEEMKQKPAETLDAKKIDVAAKDASEVKAEPKDAK